MSEFRSHKWISSGEGKALNVHKVPSIFNPVAKNPCNLISIFGRARQGKSFLMNCLAGEREIFKISNEKDSCTQGIDISSKWLSLADFSRLDGGKHIGGRTEGIRIGFVDAEGQGDKDVSYDANLICPILLASKCVIFNWKGDLQKDNILSTLGIMARAAKNIDNEGAGSGRSKFGHLHIIFRDWQAVKTDEEAVFHALLGIEGTAEGTTRDIIRSDLLSSFESIKVWLFDPPSEYTKDLKQKLVFERTSDVFRTQVRSLREALSQQLKEPTYLAGNVLTGRTYIPLTEQIADALNNGRAVLPSSAYLNMMRQEALQLSYQYDAELKTQYTQLLETLGGKNPGELYSTRAGALGKLTDLMRALQAKYQTRVAEIVGNVSGAAGSPVATILSEYAAQTQEIHSSAEAQFLALYAQQFAQWLMKARKAADKAIENEVLVLEKSLPLDNRSLSEQLEAAFSQGLNLIGGTRVYGADCVEVADAEQILRRFFDATSTSITDRNTRLNNERRRDSEAHLTNAMQEMEVALERTVQEMVTTRPAGYLMVQLEQTLNQEYHSLKKVLTTQLARSPFKDEILRRFDGDCATLRNRMIEKYTAAKVAALQYAVEQAGDVTAARLGEVDVDKHWRNTPFDACEDKLIGHLETLARDVEQGVLQRFATGWLLSMNNAAVNSSDPEVAKQLKQEEQFTAALHASIETPIDEFRALWLAELERRVDAEADAAELEAQRQQQYAAEMASNGSNDYEEVEDEEETAKPAVSKSKSSAAAQRAKAAAWAAENLTPKETKARKTTKAVAAPAPKKSVAQQRADALTFAKSEYGNDIDALSPPAKDSAVSAGGKRRNTLLLNSDEVDEEELAYRSTRKTSPVNAGSPPRAPVAKAAPAPPAAPVDRLKQAKEEAKRLAAERADAAATAAAERVARSKANKKK